MANQLTESIAMKRMQNACDHAGAMDCFLLDIIHVSPLKNAQDAFFYPYMNLIFDS